MHKIFVPKSSCKKIFPYFPILLSLFTRFCFSCVFVAVAIGTRGCSRKAGIPRDVSCDANTYRLFTRRAIFEAIRQSDIRESFAATSQESHGPCLLRKKGCFLLCDGFLSLPRRIDLDAWRTRIATHKSSISFERIRSLFLFFYCLISTSSSLFRNNRIFNFFLYDQWKVI